MPQPQINAETGSESDLESQLDQLMAQIAQKVPGTVPGIPAAPEIAPASAVAPAMAPASTATPPSGPAASDNMTIPSAAVQPEVVTEAVGAEPVAAAQPAPDLVGHALASQIQEMLDDAADQQKQAQAKATPAATREAPTTSGSATIPETQPTSTLAAKPNGRATPDAADPALRSVAKSTTPVAPVDPVDKEVLHWIDEHLAQEADNAVADDFETVHEVLAQGEGTTAPSTTAASRAGSPNPAAPANPISGGATADRTATHSSLTTHASAAPAGTHQSPAAAGRGSAGATAADVARELDEQPETAHAASAAATMSSSAASAVTAPLPITPPASSTTVVNRLRWNSPSPVHGASRTLRRVLAAVNGPLARFSPDTRANIGYVGVLVMFSGAILLGYAVWHSHQ